jgi:multidrug efflux pump subunit AcrB
MRLRRKIFARLVSRHREYTEARIWYIRALILSGEYEKARNILVTSLTGIAGAVPLALMSNGGFSAALAGGIIWGTLGSLIAALLLFLGLIAKVV